MHPPAVAAEARLAAPADEAREPPLVPRRHVDHVDLVADAVVRGERDHPSVGAPVGIAEDRVLTVARQLTSGTRPQVLQQQAFGAVQVGQERDLSAVGRDVGLVLRRAVLAHSAQVPSVRVDLPQLGPAAAVGGEDDAPPVRRPAREAVVGGVVGEPTFRPATRGDDEQVHRAVHVALVDEFPVRRSAGRRCRGNSRLPFAPGAARDGDRCQSEQSTGETQRHTRPYGEAGASANAPGWLDPRAI